MACNGYKGVFLDKSTKRYRAKHSKQSLGYYDTAEKAAKAKDLGLLAMERVTRREARGLNFSRGDYTDAEIEATVQRINAPKTPPASPYCNVDSRGSRGFEARIRCGGTRVYLGIFRTAKEAAEAADLAKMLFKGGRPAAAGPLNMDWSAVSDEELRSKQARVLETLLDKLQKTPGQKAAGCRKTLLDRNAGLLQQQQEQESQRQPAAQQQQRQQQQRHSAVQQQEQEQQRQPSVQQQQQPRRRSATQQEQGQQRQPEAQQQAQEQRPSAAQQEQETESRQAQAQGREPQIPQLETAPAPQQWVVLEVPLESVQQAMNGMQSIASGLQQAGSAMQHVASGLQQFASSVQKMFSGMKRTAGDSPNDARAPRRRLQL